MLSWLAIQYVDISYLNTRWDFFYPLMAKNSDYIGFFLEKRHGDFEEFHRVSHPKALSSVSDSRGQFSCHSYPSRFLHALYAPFFQRKTKTFFGQKNYVIFRRRDKVLGWVLEFQEMDCSKGKKSHILQSFACVLDVRVQFNCTSALK